MPVNAFLVEHPSGPLLFDTGQSALATRPGYLPRWHPYLRLARFELGATDEAAAQLAAIGVAPSSVRRVALSHLHTDHVGGIAGFAAAEVLVARAEWEHAAGLAGRLRGYVPQHWPPGVQPRLIDHTGPAVGPFAGSFDVTGDGSLVLLPTPGHSPGHQVLLIRRPGGGGWLLAGDLVHEADQLGSAAPAIDAWCRSERLQVLTAHEQAAPAA